MRGGQPAPASRPPWWRREIALPRPSRAGALAALGLLAPAVFAAREAVFLGRVFYLRDLHLQWWGQLETLVRVARSGAWPLWDPFVAFGRPLLANANNQILYPPTWLSFVMPPERYFTLFFVAHVWLAGLGVFAAARRFGASPAAAFTGAAAFTASGPLLSLGNLWNHLAAAAFLPWSLWGAERFARAPRVGGALVWGALLAAPVLAGSPDVFAMSAALGGGYAACRALAARRAGADGGATPLRAAAGFAAALLFAAALSAAQLLPSLELALASGRWRASAETRAYWSLHPLAALQALVPVFHDAPGLGPAARRALFDGREPLLLSLYVGVGALALALAAFLPAVRGVDPASRAARAGLRAFLPPAVLGALLFAFGAHGPLHGPLVDRLAPLRLLRYPSKAMLVVALGTALLAALGADAWRGGRAPFRRWLGGVVAPLVLLAGAAAALRPAAALVSPFAAELAAAAAPGLARLARLAFASAAIALLAALRPRFGGAALLLAGGLAIADPLWTHRDLNPTAPAAFYAFRPAFLPLLRDEAGRRTYVVDYSAEPQRSRRLLHRPLPYLVAGRDGPPPRWSAALGMRAYPVPPVLAGWGVFDGYSRDLLGVQPEGVARLHALLLRAEGTPLHARLLRLGSLGHVVSLHTEGLEELTLARSLRGPFFEPVRVWEVARPLPRAFVVGRARQAGDEQAAAALLAPEFDPEREVVLASRGGDAADGPPGFAGAPPGGPAGAARLVEQSADSLRVTARLERPGWLVLTDTYAPGWRAFVDGREAPISRANLAFRAVALPAGRHTVDFVYRPRPVAAGLAVSAAALLAALTAWARGRRPAPFAAPAGALRP